MKANQTTGAAEKICGFSLPSYDALPNMGLYLEQTAKYVSECLCPLGSGFALTGSMISNYVKKGLIDNPQKKQYYREQIAYLIFIAVAKLVLSIDDIKLFIAAQKRTYPTDVAYNYFCAEFQNLLLCVFGQREEPEVLGVTDSLEKDMLRNTVTAVAHVVYLEDYFGSLRAAELQRQKAKK